MLYGSDCFLIVHDFISYGTVQLHDNLRMFSFFLENIRKRVDGVRVNGMGASGVRMDGSESGCDDNYWCKSE